MNDQKTYFVSKTTWKKTDKKRKNEIRNNADVVFIKKIVVHNKECVNSNLVSKSDLNQCHGECREVDLKQRTKTFLSKPVNEIKT